MSYIPKFQKADGTPDWSLAPADATHYTPETDKEYESFLRVTSNVVWFANDDFGLDEWTPDLVTTPQEVKTNITGQYIAKETN